jgi:hypothetical protein
MAVCLPEPVPRRHLLALAGGIVASAFGSMAGAYYQFGLLCCERHHTFRQGLLVVLIVVLARLATLIRPRAGLMAALGGPLCLVAATGVGLATRLPGLVNDYRILPTDLRVAEQNWAALRAPGPEMVFRLPVHGMVIEGLIWQPGHYTIDWTRAYPVAAALTYFGKTGGDVVATPPPP